MDKSNTFSSWMTEVDTAIHFLCGLISDDLPDVNYWDMWDEGKTPMSAAKYTIRWASCAPLRSWTVI